ncbi:MAG: hypothetical protein JNM68_00660, partial [Dinghuibacter sp.]|nr:hypothetical protein [Dinghuibacter sp.]
MKRTLTATLFMLLATLQLNAQRKSIAYPSQLAPVSKTEAIFSKPLPGYPFIHRIQVHAKNKMRIDIILQKMEHLEAVRNLDSILSRVWDLILPLKDSFPNDLNNRLLDVNFSPNGQAKLRISTFLPQGESYVSTTEGLARLKIEQDTLHLTGFVATEVPATKFRDMEITGAPKTPGGNSIVYLSWQVIILINNLSGLPEVVGTINPYMENIAANYVALTGYKTQKRFNNAVHLVYEPLSNFTGLDKYMVYQ